MLSRQTTGEIRPLTGIRIVAAGWVMVEHFREPLFLFSTPNQAIRDVVDSGYLGVELFFVLSGFIISHNYALQLANFTWPTYIRFVQARIARIYPVHLVTLVAIIVLVTAAGIAGVDLNSGENYTIGEFVKNLVLMQAIPEAHAWNFPAWSISVEMIAYLAFPLIAFCVLAARSRPRLALVGLSLAFGWTIIGALLFAGHGDQFSAIAPMMMWLRISGEFIGGCFIWALWFGMQPSRVGDALALLGLTGIVIVILSKPGVGSTDFFALPFIGLVVFGCANATGPVSKFLSTRWMQNGGRISYCLYMWHFIVLIIIGKAVPWTEFASSGTFIKISVLCGYYLAAICGAVVLYHLIEKPGRLLLLHGFRGKSESAIGVRAPLDVTCARSASTDVVKIDLPDDNESRSEYAPNKEHSLGTPLSTTKGNQSPNAQSEPSAKAGNARNGSIK